MEGSSISIAIKVQLNSGLFSKAPEDCPRHAERIVPSAVVPRTDEKLCLRAKRRGMPPSEVHLTVADVHHFIDDGQIEVVVVVDVKTMQRLVESHGFRPTSS